MCRHPLLRSRASSRVSDPDPVFKNFSESESGFSAPSQIRILGTKVCRKYSKRGLRSGLGSGFFPESVSKSDLERIMDTVQVCPERLDPDPVNIRPDPNPGPIPETQNTAMGSLP